MLRLTQFMDKIKAAKLLWGIFVLVTSCESHYDERRVFNFLFRSQWDSLGRHIEEPSEDLSVIMGSGLEMVNKYTFELDTAGVIVLLNEKPADTIQYIWHDSIQKIQFDSTEVLRLFANEPMIRLRLVAYFMKAKKPEKAWVWLNDPKPLEVDTMFGNFFKEMYYAVNPRRYSEFVPTIERGWAKGHQNSGLALSDLYIFLGRRDDAIDILKTLAAQLNSEAMVELADIYETYFSGFGYDPPEDATPESSFKWLTAAAALKNSTAMYKLGFIYQRGINRKVDLDSAYYWYKRSSVPGESGGTVAIAKMYLEGDYLTENVDSGIHWFHKAIQQEPGYGYMELGNAYEEGYLLDRDLKMALKYYLMADSVRSPVAKLSIDEVRKKLNVARENQ